MESCDEVVEEWPRGERRERGLMEGVDGKESGGVKEEGEKGKRK